MTNGMRNLAARTAKKVDEHFAEREKQLLADTTFNWEEIRPELSDSAEYDRLMEEVAAATKRNESIGQLVARLKTLGESGIALANKVKSFVVG